MVFNETNEWFLKIDYVKCIENTDFFKCIKKGFSPLLDEFFRWI